MRCPLLLTTLLLLAAAASAAPLSFEAQHGHTLGSCRGTLVFDDTELRYESREHSFQWPYSGVQELKLLDAGRVRVLTYEDRGKLLLGTDRAFHFHVEGPLEPAARMLAEKLDQRLVVGFATRPETVLAEFPVKHVRTLRGEDGKLAFGEDLVSFIAESSGESRTWRYSDIESISTTGPFRLTLTTFERQRGQYGNRRQFNFQLKRAISEETFNRLWRRVHRDNDLELLEKLRSGLDRRVEQIANTPPAGLPGLSVPTGPDRATDSAATNSAAGNSAATNSAATVRERSGGPIPAARVPHGAVMERVLHEEGLPNSFLAVAKVESGFNRFALSPKNARGLWQFIPETARRFGLRVDSRADERVDPEKSTRAAARYLKELHQRFGDWKLALAGYNAGEQRVERAIERSGSREFGRLAPLLPAETRQYVPAVMAAFGAPLAAVWQTSPGGGYRVFAPVAFAD